MVGCPFDRLSCGADLRCAPRRCGPVSSRRRTYRWSERWERAGAAGEFRVFENPRPRDWRAAFDHRSARGAARDHLAAHRGVDCCQHRLCLLRTNQRPPRTFVAAKPHGSAYLRRRPRRARPRLWQPTRRTPRTFRPTADDSKRAQAPTRPKARDPPGNWLFLEGDEPASRSNKRPVLK